MGNPNYFSYLPNLDYTIKLDKAGNTTNIDIKDYFHLLKVREDIYKEETLYEPYFVKDGARPEQVSYELYGDERYYWVVLQVNDIVDYYNEWPLSSYELDQYIKDKYGFPGSEDIHHWETLEVKDLDGNVILDNVGEYNASAGTLSINAFEPSQITTGQSYLIFSIVPEQDSVVKPLRNYILKLDTAKSSATATVDRQTTSLEVSA